MRTAIGTNIAGEWSALGFAAIDVIGASPAERSQCSSYAAEQPPRFVTWHVKATQGHG
jgi:hypothetical protein